MSFNTPSQNVKEFEVEPKQQSEERTFFKANLFSCMDAPDYQRDFEISPKIITKEWLDLHAL